MHWDIRNNDGAASEVPGRWVEIKLSPYPQVRIPLLREKSVQNQVLDTFIDSCFPLWLHRAIVSAMESLKDWS